MPGDNSNFIPRDAFLETSDGLIFTIEVSAGRKRDKFPDGYNPWRKAIGIAVMAPPAEGRANKAIISLIAKYLNIPQKSVIIVSGHAFSVKKVRISGPDCKEILNQFNL